MYSNRGQTTLQTNKRNLHDLKTTSRLSGSVSSLPAVIFTLCHFLIVSLKGEYSVGAWADPLELAVDTRGYGVS